MTVANAHGGTVHSLKTKITTPLFEETKDFYRSLLGLVAIEEWDEGDDVGCIMGLAGKGGEAFLEIYRGNQRHDFAGLSLQFHTPDIAAFEASVRGRVSYQGPTKRPWGNTYLYFTDPNRISVIVFDGGN